MNKNDLDRLKAKIVAKLACLEISAGMARATLKESSEVIPNFLQDEAEAAKGGIDIENSMKVYQNTTLQQKQLSNALLRMESGSYGTCKDCWDEISLRRLEAMPSAHLCTACQCAREYGYVREVEPKKKSSPAQMRCAA